MPVYTQNPYQGIDPSLIAAINQGQAAQQQQGGIMSSPAMIRALRQSKTEMPGMRAGRAASPLAFLGAMAQRHTGDRRIDEMQAQSKLLRGEQAAGQAAAQKLRFAEKDIGANLDNQRYQAQVSDRAAAAEKAVTERQRAANKAYARDKEIRLEEASDLVTTPNVWVNEKTGEKIVAGRSKGRGMINPDTKEKLALEGFVPYKDKLAASMQGVANFSNLDGKQKDSAVGAYEGIRALNGISTVAKSLSPEGMAVLNRPLMDAAVKAATPAAFEQYVQNNMRGYPQEVKDYLMRVNEFSVKIRNQYFGSALTMNEQQIAETFLPSAAGLGLDDIMLRIDGLAGSYGGLLQSIDGVHGTNLYDRKPKYTPYAMPENTPGGLDETKQKRLAELVALEAAEQAAVTKQQLSRNPRAVGI